MSESEQWMMKRLELRLRSVEDLKAVRKRVIAKRRELKERQGVVNEEAMDALKAWVASRGIVIEWEASHSFQFSIATTVWRCNPQRGTFTDITEERVQK